MTKEKPRYQEVIDWVQEEVSSGMLKTGDRLPSEKDLGEKFSLSRQTIRHATDILEQSGFITRVRGSGSFIGSGADNTGADRRQRQRTMNIAVMMTFTYSYIFTPVLKGISSVLEERGYSAQIYYTNNSKERERRTLTNLLEADNIDGLIAEPSRSALPDTNHDLYQKLIDQNIPVLFINAGYDDMDCPIISLDDFETARQAVLLAAKAGHKHIGGLFHAEDAQGQHRYLGYVKGIEDAGLTLNEEKIVWIDTVSVSDLEPMTDYILHRLQGCTAVLTYNDEVASQLISSLKRRDIRVPEDLSIVSIDDAETAGSTSTITTFPHPKDLLGRRSAVTILRMIEDPGYDGSYRFMPQPIIRDTLYDLNKGSVYTE